MKTCGTCKKRKALSEFHRKEQGHQSYCKACQKIYRDAHYRANRDKQIAQMRARRKILVQRLWDYKSGRACVDCGGSFLPPAMDFDHLGGKERDVSNMISGGWSWSRVLKEIEKCDLVCANCHRIRTYNRARVSVA